MGETNRIPAEVFPPGEFIREELEARDWTQEVLAIILKKPLPAVNEIILGKKAITADTARALGEAFGTSPELWLNLERDYRLAMATESDDGVAKRAKLYSTVPLTEMVRRQWIEWSDDVDTLERNVLSFFRADSIDDIKVGRFAARKSTDYGTTTIAEWAWYCKAIKMAELVPAKKYNEKAFATAGLRGLRRLMGDPEETRHVPRILSDYGIRFVIVKHLPKTRLDGATLWMDNKKSIPGVALSMRFDRIDSFWFTLIHELKHILNKDDPGPESNLVGQDRQPTEEKPEIERIADDFASEFLVPEQDLTDFIRRTKPLYSKVKINQFANRLGVHPGIVVGQLQHRREIGWGHSREKLVKVSEIVATSALVDE